MHVCTRAPNGRTLLICNNFTYSKALYTNDVSGYNKVQKYFFLHWIKKKRLCERFTKEKQRMLIYQRKQHFFSQSRCPKNWANENYPKIAIIEKSAWNVDVSTKTFSKNFKNSNLFIKKVCDKWKCLFTKYLYPIWYLCLKNGFKSTFITKLINNKTIENFTKSKKFVNRTFQNLATIGFSDKFR